MANVIPFKGLRYNPDKVGNLSDVVAPPYDIISPDEQKRYYDKHEKNVIRLEYGMEYPSDDETNNRYTRAAGYLKSWLDEGVLQIEDTECIYLYEQRFMHYNQEMAYRGFITLVELEEFSKGVILPHEETLSKAKTDRFNLMSATYSNFSQVFCLYIDQQQRFKSLMEEITSSPPEISFKTSDGITQNLWIIKDAKVIDEIRAQFADKQLFIADGHHRYETALNFRNKMRQENPGWTRDDMFNYVMMALVDMDDPGLLVFPTHRVVSGLASFDEIRVVSALKDDFDIDRIIVDSDSDQMCEAMLWDLLTYKEDNVFALYCSENYYYRLRLRDKGIMDKYLPDKSDSYRNLDVSVLHTLALDKVLGIDAESLEDQRYLTYTRNAKEAIDQVKSGKCQCAFILNATKVHEIKGVSLAGEKMPQKSTYFYPKLITGLVMNKIK